MKVTVETKVNIDDIPLKFGKYKGITPNELFEQKEYSYIIWLYDNVKGQDCISDDLYEISCCERESGPDIGDLWSIY